MRGTAADMMEELSSVIIRCAVLIVKGGLDEVEEDQRVRDEVEDNQGEPSRLERSTACKGLSTLNRHLALPSIPSNQVDLSS